jgi:hypothetical protein
VRNGGHGLPCWLDVPLRWVPACALHASLKAGSRQGRVLPALDASPWPKWENRECKITPVQCTMYCTTYSIYYLWYLYIDKVHVPWHYTRTNLPFMYCTYLRTVSTVHPTSTVQDRPQYYNYPQRHRQEQTTSTPPRLPA